MKRLIAAAFACGLLLAVGVKPAQAQGPYVRPSTSPFSRPAVSPYMNLFRGGSTAVNYFDLVRTQQEFGDSIQQLQSQMQTSRLATTNADGGSNLPTTGHPSRFFSHQSYFFTHQGSGGSNSKTGSGTPTPGAVPVRPGQPAPRSTK